MSSTENETELSSRIKELETKRNQLSQSVAETVVTEGKASREDAEESQRAEVSAKAIGRMMGLATVSELRLLEAKIDVTNTRLEALGHKLDKCTEQLSKLPSGADQERVEVQLASIRGQLKELLQQLLDTED